MQEAFFCFTVDDVGMPGYSSETHLEKLLQFCAEADIKATLFVVPRPQGQRFQRGNGYAKLLHSARQSGHAIGQHGLEHDRFEVGIPPQMVLDLPHEGPAREYLATHRNDIDRSLTVDSLRERLREGRAILEDALGHAADGFRAPCLATCDNLFTALEAEGYRYDSSRFFQKAGWDLINGQERPVPSPITRAHFDSYQFPGQLRVFPLTTEYTWYLTRDRFDAFLQLAKHDFNACLSAGVPFVQLSHVSPIQEGDGDSGFALYRELLAYAKQTAQQRGMRLVSTTLAELPRLWAR